MAEVATGIHATLKMRLMKSLDKTLRLPSLCYLVMKILAEDHYSEKLAIAILTVGTAIII